MCSEVKSILSSHGGESEDDCLLGCSALRMEAARTSDTPPQPRRQPSLFNIMLRP